MWHGRALAMLNTYVRIAFRASIELHLFARYYLFAHYYLLLCKVRFSLLRSDSFFPVRFSARKKRHRFHSSLFRAACNVNRENRRAMNHTQEAAM